MQQLKFVKSLWHKNQGLWIGKCSKWAFHSIFCFSFWSTKLQKYQNIMWSCLFTFLLSKAIWVRQKFKTKTNLKKITQVKWPKYKKTKYWNEKSQTKGHSFIIKSVFCLRRSGYWTGNWTEKVYCDLSVGVLQT